MKLTSTLFIVLVIVAHKIYMLITLWFFYHSLRNTLSILVNHWKFIAFIFHEYFNIFFHTKSPFILMDFNYLFPLMNKLISSSIYFFCGSTEIHIRSVCSRYFQWVCCFFLLLFRSFLENTRSIHTIIKRNCQYLGIIKCMLWLFWYICCEKIWFAWIFDCLLQMCDYTNVFTSFGITEFPI